MRKLDVGRLSLVELALMLLREAKGEKYSRSLAASLSTFPRD